MEPRSASAGLSRRTFLQCAGAAGLGLVVGCGRLSGESTARPPAHSLGYLGTEAFYPRLRQALSELGYTEGRNLTMDSFARYVAGPATREAATELMQVPVDAMV